MSSPGDFEKHNRYPTGGESPGPTPSWYGHPDNSRNFVGAGGADGPNRQLDGPHGQSGGITGPPGMRYQGLGVFDQQQHRPARARATSIPRHRGLIISAVSVATLMVVTVATTLYVIASGDGGKQISPALAAPLCSTIKPRTATDPPGSTPSENRRIVQSTTPDWQGIGWPDFHIAYDIPPHWHPGKGRWVGGATDTSPGNNSLSAYSASMDTCCGPAQRATRGLIGVTTSPESNLAIAGNHMIQKWAKLGYSSRSEVPPRVTVHQPRPVKVAAGRLDAVLVSGTVAPAGGATWCGAPSAFVSAVVLSKPQDSTPPPSQPQPPKPQGSVMLVSFGDQGVPEATPPESLHRILTSFRALPQ